MAFGGALQDVSIVDVLQLLHSTRKTGVLTVYGPRGRAIIVLKGGRITEARHPVEGMTAGRLLLDMRAIGPADLEAALAHQQAAEEQQRQPLVATLVQLGLLHREAGWMALRKLVEATIAELTSWDDGHVVFEPSEIEVCDDFRHVPDGIVEGASLDTQATLMEALRLVDEQQRDRDVARAEGMNDPLPVERGRARTPARAATGGPKVLLVEHDHALLSALARVLAAGGYDVTCASSGREALLLAGARVFEAALIALDLPMVDGLQVLRHVGELQPSCRRLLLARDADIAVGLGAVRGGDATKALRKSVALDEVTSVLGQTLASPSRATRPPVRAAPALDRAQASALRRCMEENALQLALQPIVHASTTDIWGFEALLRCSSAAFGSPADVLDAAEKSGRVDELADIVASRASAWLNCLPEHFRVFVNMHPRELAAPRVLAARLAGLAQFRGRLVFEITERERIPTGETLHACVRALRERGFGLAIDDLGAGWSSLSLVTELQPDFVKIDRSLVSDVDQDRKKEGLVEALIRGSKRAGATVIAEGVERQREAEILRDSGADLLQGYLFGRPSLSARCILQNGRFRFDDARQVAPATCATRGRR